jgi:hypothetical protein
MALVRESVLLLKLHVTSAGGAKREVVMELAKDDLDRLLLDFGNIKQVGRWARSKCEGGPAPVLWSLPNRAALLTPASPRFFLLLLLRLRRLCKRSVDVRGTGPADGP